MQLILHLVGGLVDLAQQCQEQGGVPVQKLQRHALLLFGAAIFHLPAGHGPGQGHILQADGDDVFARQDDAEGDGGIIGGVAVVVHHGGVHQNQGGAVLLFNAASLLFVEGSPHQVGVHMQLGAHPADLLLVGSAHVNPGAGADLILLQQPAAIGEIN